MKIYGCRVKDKEVLMDSRSGGAFSVLSDIILAQGGAVYGCVLGNDMQAEHRRAVSAEERDNMRGSKYVQSKTLDTFEQAADDLKDGMPVLYSGTSCQIAGLLSYMRAAKVDTEKLYTVDIICHGVPSPMVFNDYIAWLKKKYHIKNISSYEFRNKKSYGWKEAMETVHTRKRDYDISVYSRLFYKRHILRPVCYSCPYKSFKHESDITLGDFWGIEKIDKGKKYNDDKGLSLLLAHTKKGEELLEMVKPLIEWFECTKDECIQPRLLSSSKKPSNREEFWLDYSKGDFDLIARKYAGYSLQTYFKGKIPGKLSRKIYKLLHKR